MSVEGDYSCYQLHARLNTALPGTVATDALSQPRIQLAALHCFAGSRQLSASRLNRGTRVKLARSVGCHSIGLCRTGQALAYPPSAKPF